MSRAVLAVLFFGLGAGDASACGGKDVIDGENAALVEQSRENVAAYFRLPVAQGTLDNGSGGDKVRLRAVGRPGNEREVSIEGVVFRHYVDPTKAAEIHRTGRLRAGTTHYVHGDDPKWYRIDYHDVLGIFFTLPRFTAKQVGVFELSVPIDFTLLPGTAVVELENGFLLIPGTPNETEIPIRIVGP